jgi:hypothetical protein
MNYHKGYYSLIQFCPDRGRAEAANIGVLLLCPDLGFVRSQMSSEYSRIGRFFGKGSFDAERLRLIQHGIGTRVQENFDWSQGLEDLERFISTRANDVQLTPARALKTADPAADLDVLFGELVGGVSLTMPTAAMARDSGPSLPDAFARLDAGLKSPDIRDRVTFDKVIQVPVLGTQFEVPYAYQSGTVNLVKPCLFAGTPKTVTREASNLAVEGGLLKRHAVEGYKHQLIVLTSFAGRAKKSEERVTTLLSDFDVRVVDEDHVDDLLAEITKSAA